jgi:pimeloyl-ACP methyl ester carboxylesterase
MKTHLVRIVMSIALLSILFSSCMMSSSRNETSTQTKSGYSDVNGIKMYYEIHGQGKPLVLIHGGGSTIETSFGNLIPLLEKRRQLICVELQAHGHTGDRNADLSFKQDADDVTTLLKNLDIAKADVLGFSNGGQTAIEIALRHPDILDRIIIAAAMYNRSGVPVEFWNGFDQATLDNMPLALRQGQLKANGGSQAALLNSFRKDVQRMKTFEGWTDEQIKSITAKTLIINGTHDVATVEHSVSMHRLIANSELAIFPGVHGTYIGSSEGGGLPEFNAAPLINQFLGN